MRVLPSDLYSEKLLLALIMQNPNQMVTILDAINVKDFFDNKHQEIFATMEKLYRREEIISLTTITQTLTKNKKLMSIGGIDFLEELNATIVALSELPSLLNTIKEAAIKRMVYTLSDDLSNRALATAGNAEELLDFAEEKIYQISKRKNTTEFIHVKEIAEQFRETTETLHKQGGKIIGLDPGYSNITEIIPGFQPEQFIILAARPGIGKSAFALNLAYKIAIPKSNQKKKRIAFFSLEMSNEQILSRLISLVGNIDSYKLTTAKLGAEDFKKFYATIDDIKQFEILFDDASSSNINDVRAKCRKLKEQSGLDFVIIDYLQLLNTDTKLGVPRQEVVSRISRSLKELARELKIPILALSQLSREVTKNEDNKPELSNLRESGSLEQDADIVLLIHKPGMKKGYDQFSDYDNLEIEIAKNRQGRTGKCYFLFEKKYSRFTIRQDMHYENEGDISEAN